MVLSGPLCMGQSRGDENEYRLRLDCEKAGRGDQSISNGLAGTVSESPCCNQRSRPGCDHSLLLFASAPSAGGLARFISLILRCRVRRLMPSFLAAAVTLPFVVASACMINFFSVSCRSSGLDFSPKASVAEIPRG